MVDSQCLAFEDEDGDQGEDRQRDEFLDHLELPQVKRTTIPNIADSIGRNHEGVFRQRNPPTEEHNQR